MREERLADGKNEGIRRWRETEPVWAESGTEQLLCKDINGEKYDMTMGLQHGRSKEIQKRLIW